MNTESREKNSIRNFAVGSVNQVLILVLSLISKSIFIKTLGPVFLGLNGSDMMSYAGVYAPYMAIVPTQLLGTPDGGMAQGFSTWYAKALLNENLLVAGEITA